MEQLCSSQPSDTIVLASGDGDFMPVIRKAIEKTFNVEIWSFKSGGKDEFLNMYFYLIQTFLGDNQGTLSI